MGDQSGSGPVAQTDALGGAGSISPALQAIAVNGISRAVDGFLSTKYPLTAFNEPYSSEGAGAFEPGGQLVPRGAPGWTTGYGVAPLVQSPASLLANPVVLGVAVIAVIAVIVVLSK
jgi:hypothetical protein